MRFIRFYKQKVTCFAPEDKLMYLLGLYNSAVIQRYLAVVSPTLDYHEGPLGKTPVIIHPSDEINRTVTENVEICKTDWDNFETSWDFSHHPLLLLPQERMDAECSQFAKDRMKKLGSLDWHYERWSEECQDRFNTPKQMKGA